jgi:hypothetical protein
VQALLQQTPSTHCFEAHWLFVAQICPSACRPQPPFTQATPDPQSASVRHEQLFVLALQPPEPQSVRLLSTQFPAPSQVAAGVQTELAQVDGAQNP